METTSRKDTTSQRQLVSAWGIKAPTATSATTSCVQLQSGPATAIQNVEQAKLRAIEQGHVLTDNLHLARDASNVPPTRADRQDGPAAHFEAFGGEGVRMEAKVI
jgi:hypothetical protein